MTITADLLKTAAASFTEINKGEEPTVKVIDLAKITDAVIEATASLQDATDDNAAAVTEALVKRLEDLTSLLAKAVQDEDGLTATVTPETEDVTKLAEEFEVEKATPTAIGSRIRSLREAKGWTIAQLNTAVGNILNDPFTVSGPIERGEIVTPSDPVIAAMARSLGTTKAILLGLLPAGAKPLEEARGAGKAAKSDGGEDEDESEWPLDMAPSTPPLLKSARMTKGERPIPARPGARARVQKRYGEKRDAAFGRSLSPVDEDK